MERHWLWNLIYLDIWEGIKKDITRCVNSESPNYEDSYETCETFAVLKH